MRDNEYLIKKLHEVWSRHFADTPRHNQVEIFFGRKAKKRLGYIKSKNLSGGEKNLLTQISINGHFKHKKVPEFVLVATIAHELCHYIHGVGSPLPLCVDHPHRGGVVEKEMAVRGLAEIQQKEKNWLNANWKDFLENSMA